MLGRFLNAATINDRGIDMTNNTENKKKSLGASMWFASSDISQLKKTSEKEAEAILSNRSFKIALKTSDSVGGE